MAWTRTACQLRLTKLNNHKQSPETKPRRILTIEKAAQNKLEQNCATRYAGHPAPYIRRNGFDENFVPTEGFGDYYRLEENNIKGIRWNVHPPDPPVGKNFLLCGPAPPPTALGDRRRRRELLYDT